MSTSAPCSDRAPRGVGLRDALLLLLLGACAAALHSRVLFGGRTYFSIDLTHVNFAWRSLTAEQLQRGQAPLWNPYAFMGMPLAGNMQTGVLHPLSALFQLFPFAGALGWVLWLHHALAASGTYLWLRAWRFGRAASAGAAAVYGLGGFLVGYLQFPNLQGAVAHFPWLLLFAGRLELTALASGLMFLAGYPPCWVLGAAAASGLTALWSGEVPGVPGASCAPGTAGSGIVPAAPRRVLGRTLAGLALGLALAGAVLVPGIETFARSSRGGGLELETRVQNAVRPVGLAGLVAPELARRLSFLLQTPAPRREQVVWADAAGKTTFTFDSVYQEHFKDPSGIKYIPQVSFYLGAVAFLLALAGFVRLARASPARALAAAAGACLAAVLLLGTFHPLSRRLWSLVPGLQFIRGPSRLSILLVALAAPLVALGIQTLERGGAVLAARLAPALIAAELLWLGWGYYPTMPRTYWRERGALVDCLRERLGGLRYFQVPSAEVWAYVDKEDPSEAYRRFKEEVFRTFKQKLFGVSNSVWHLPAASGSFEPMVSSAADAAVMAMERADTRSLENLMRWSGTRLWLSRTKDKGEPLEYRGQCLWHVYEALGVPGRAFWLPEDHRSLMDAAFGQAPLLEGAAALEETWEREDRVRLRGSAPAKGIVYLAEPHYPGWELFLGGKKTALRKALGTFMYFDAEPGPVDARLVYRPWTWLAGIALSLCVLGTLAGLGALRLARVGEQ